MLRWLPDIGDTEEVHDHPVRQQMSKAMCLHHLRHEREGIEVLVALCPEVVGAGTADFCHDRSEQWRVSPIYS